MPKAPKATLAQLLEPFRTAEGSMAHTAVVLDEQRDLMRLCAAWTTMVVRWTYPPGAVPDSEAARWDWIWNGVDFEVGALAKRSGIMENKLLDRFEILRAARLVYPDGTVANVAKLIMRTAVAKSSGAAARKRNDG